VDAGVVKRAEESAAAVYETAARIRNLKAACGLPARRDLGFVLKPSVALPGRELATLGVLAGAGSIAVDGEYVKGRNTAGALTPLGEVYLPLTGLIDIEAERARLGKELERVQGEVAKVDAKLGSESFVSRAPEEVVEEHRQRRADWLTQSSQLGEMLRNLG
jgi:valyl-tRNA synthetase